MARKDLWQPLFDPTADYVIRKPIKLGGKKLPAGSLFPMHSVGLRRARQLYDQRAIVMASTEEAKAIPEADPKELADQLSGASVPETPVSATETPSPSEGSITEAPAPDSPSGETPELVPKGGGWYNVEVGGQVLNESALRKEDAEALIDKLNADVS